MRLETRNKCTLWYKFDTDLALEVLLFEELVPENTMILRVRYTRCTEERKHSPAKVRDHQLLKLPGLHQSN